MVLIVCVVLIRVSNCKILQKTTSEISVVQQHNSCEVKWVKWGLLCSVT